MGDRANRLISAAKIIMDEVRAADESRADLLRIINERALACALCNDPYLVNDVRFKANDSMLLAAVKPLCQKVLNVELDNLARDENVAKIIAGKDSRISELSTLVTSTETAFRNISNQVDVDIFFKDKITIILHLNGLLSDEPFPGGAGCPTEVLEEVIQKLIDDTRTLRRKLRRVAGVKKSRKKTHG